MLTIFSRRASLFFVNAMRPVSTVTRKSELCCMILAAIEHIISWLLLSSWLLNYYFLHILTARKNVYWKAAYAVFYLVQNLYFLTSSVWSFSVDSHIRPLDRYLFILAFFSYTLLKYWLAKWRILKRHDWHIKFSRIWPCDWSSSQFDVFEHSFDWQLA